MASFADFVKEINQREAVQVTPNHGDHFVLFSWPDGAGGPVTKKYIPRGPEPPKRQWTEPSPIGNYFNVIENGEIFYYGRIFGEPTFGTFQCEMFDVNTDDEYDAKVPASSMKSWLWYRSEDAMWDGQDTFVPAPVALVAPAAPVLVVLPPAPVKLPKAPPAPMGQAALHGIVGDFVRLVEASTEGDVNALVVAFLTSFGCLFGRKPHHYVEDTRHGTNLFSVIVGESAKARKGTITGRVMNLLKMTNKEFSEQRVQKGLSSGEGLVYAIRDARESQQPTREPGDPEPKGKPVAADPGVMDKRLLVVESEFGSVLQQGKREGNILSEVMRNGWDSVALGSMAKTNQDRCLEPHVSLLGNITCDELQRCLSEKDRANGFGNRILWVYAKRSKILSRPERVPEKDLQVIADRISGLTMFRMPGELKWSESAWSLWDAEYARLSADSTGDRLVDALIARAEAQVLRMAMIYAVLDSSSLIERVHLEAALEVWRYCEDSAKFIFGGATGNKLAEDILGLLLARPEGMSQTDLSAAFNRKRTASELKAAIDVLVRLGKVRQEERKQDMGRAATMWVAVGD